MYAFLLRKLLLRTHHLGLCQQGGALQSWTIVIHNESAGQYGCAGGESARIMMALKAAPAAAAAAARDAFGAASVSTH